jgi:hypothetical protein
MERAIYAGYGVGSSCGRKNALGYSYRDLERCRETGRARAPDGKPVAPFPRIQQRDSDIPFSQTSALAINRYMAAEE